MRCLSQGAVVIRHSGTGIHCPFTTHRGNAHRNSKALPLPPGGRLGEPGSPSAHWGKSSTVSRDRAGHTAALREATSSPTTQWGWDPQRRLPGDSSRCGSPSLAVGQPVISFTQKKQHLGIRV